MEWLNEKLDNYFEQKEEERNKQELKEAEDLKKKKENVKKGQEVLESIIIPMLHEMCQDFNEHNLKCVVKEENVKFKSLAGDELGRVIINIVKKINTYSLKVEIVESSQGLTISYGNPSRGMYRGELKLVSSLKTVFENHLKAFVDKCLNDF